MIKDIASIRQDYSKHKLDKRHVPENPFEQFEHWLQQAIEAKVFEPTAMTLATATRDATPSSRTVLLKGVEDQAFLFYTNYQSKKGQQLIENPRAAMTFFWPELERQVNITGEIEKAHDAVSDDYFASRPRKSQLGAWASAQSEEIRSRIQLIRDFITLSAKYVGREVPRPPHWGGFKLAPKTIEFWQGRPNRLHDRIEYRVEKGKWKIRRLSP